MADAAEKFKAKKKQYPNTLNELSEGKANLMPKCPKAGKCTYVYQLRNNGKSFVIYCKGGYHMCAGLESDYPRYDSSKRTMLMKPGKPLDM